MTCARQRRGRPSTATGQSPKLPTGRICFACSLSSSPALYFQCGWYGLLINTGNKTVPDYAPSSANSDIVQIMNNGDWWRHAMARNVVQFQKGLSEPAFEQQYGTEEQCRAIVIELRWPDGFECPACGGHVHSLVQTRGLFQCSTCRRQTSPIAGTIFAATKLPLRIWFRAMYHMTQTKQGISSIELGRRLGVSQPTAWKIKHKL